MPAARRGRLSNSRAWRHHAPCVMPVSRLKVRASVRSFMCASRAHDCSVTTDDGSLMSCVHSATSAGWRGIGTCSDSSGAISISSRINEGRRGTGGIRCAAAAGRPAYGSANPFRYASDAGFGAALLACTRNASQHTPTPSPPTMPPNVPIHASPKSRAMWLPSSAPAPIPTL